ncbi:glutamate racemase [Limnohabitans planktonicus]|uniref:Glutamate racemase n=1 Tax=Limnohabitans planktonicus II-D5 TaxID=1293045 RepID=A0A2T7UFT2_9BURK|nr:glutamate racemase [Limnohabitans planktonicus]PVE43514.1 glutamate racemase [Limnohabitans planktonicus II-D5]
MNESPIGVFDSGIGGLSVLQALQSELPAEHFVYWADSAHAPYGEKGDVFVRQRSLAIARHLIERHRIKALVVACNTATAAAIHELRNQHPHLPLIGVEPALKPAIAMSRTQRIGVIGTQGTLSSDKFHRLLVSLQDQAEFVVQPCQGLALAIEQSTHAPSAPQAHEKVRQLLQDYTRQMGRFGTAPGDLDTLVLGCTHYVFAHQPLRDLLGPDVQLVSTGGPVARQTRRLLEFAGQLRSGPAPLSASARTQLLTNGELSALQAAAQRWLHLPHSTCHKAERQI